MKEKFAQQTLLLMLVMLCSASIALAGYQPVWEEYFSGGTYDQTWTDIYVGTADEGTFNIVSSDDYYTAGLVFPNPSGDNYALRCDTTAQYIGTRGMVGGDNTWTDYMVSTQIFVCIDETYRHDTMLMGRTDVSAPSWGSGVRFGYFTQDAGGWGITVPCWAMRKNFDGPFPNTLGSLTSHGWHRLTMVFSGNHVDAYLDMSYEEIVNAINTSTPPFLQADYDLPPYDGTPPHPSAGGVGFYGCYMIMPSEGPSGAPLYVDDIEVYLPPYELAPPPTPEPGAAAEPSWTLYE